MPLFDIPSLDIRGMMAKHMHDIMFGHLAEMNRQVEYYINQPEETPPKKLFFEAYKGTETKDGTPCVVTMVMPRFALKESLYNTYKIHTEIVARFAFVKKIEKYNGGGQWEPVSECVSIQDKEYVYRKGRLCFPKGKGKMQGIYAYVSSKERAVIYALRRHHRKNTEISGDKEVDVYMKATQHSFLAKKTQQKDLHY